MPVTIGDPKYFGRLIKLIQAVHEHDLPEDLLDDIQPVLVINGLLGGEPAAPGEPFIPPGGARGRIRNLVGVNPAAGNNFFITPTGTDGRATVVWQILTCGLVLTSSAVAASRFLSWTYDDGAAPGVNFAEMPGQQVQGGALAVFYSITRSGSVIAQTGNGIQAVSSVGADLFLLPGMRLGTFVASIQAADQISSIRLQVEEWDAP